MLRAFHIPLTWTELVKRTLRETSADRCLGLAAELAYYFLLALVPAIVFLAAVASFFPARLIQDMLDALGRFAPPDVLRIVREQLTSIQGGENSGILTFGLLLALWSSSAAIVSITDALNRAYDIEEGRPWWKVRLTAIGLTIALAIFVLCAFTLIMLGPTIAEWIAARMGLGGAFTLTWNVVQWPVVFALIVLGVAFVNYFAPDAEQDWEWVTPGAVLATILWLVASLVFKFYLANFADYNATYGSLGGVIVLMLWFYISGLSILVGAEMNAEIEHASPYGKDPGEKVPGQKRKLGAAAARAYEERKRREAATPQPARPVTPPAIPPRPAIGVPVYTGAILYTIARWFRRVRD
jgi:membrane protein